MFRCSNSVIAFKTVRMVSSGELVTFFVGFGWERRAGIESKLVNLFRSVLEEIEQS